jgi:hypothetical protein
MHLPDRVAKVRERANRLHSANKAKFAGPEGFETLLTALNLDLQEALDHARAEVELVGEHSVVALLKSDFEVRG